MSTELFEAIEGIGKSFEQFKQVNDARLDEEKKGNEARAKELAETLEKISADLTDNQKKKEALEKKLSMQADRLELLEATMDKPRMSIKDKMHAEHKELAIKWIRSGGKDRDAEVKAEELALKAREVKDVTIGTNLAGGFALPTEIAEMVDKILLKTSPITQYVKNVRAGTSDYKELVSVNDAGYAWAAETTDRSSNTTTPSLRQRTPTWGELYSYPRASNWSLQDVFFDVEKWLVESIAEGHSVGLSAAIWNGDGSSKPTGFIHTAPATSDDGNEASPQRAHGAFQYVPIASPSSPYTTSGITPDTLFNVLYKLNPRLRGNARWAMNTLTQSHVRKLKDTTNQYLWQPGLQAGQPDRLLGYEVFTWEEMGNPTTAGHYPIAFGDFNKAYTLVTRSEMQIIRENVTDPGFTNWFVARRYGGIVTNNSAVKLAKVAVS